MHTLGTCQHISQVGRLGCAPATGVCAEAESAARVWLPTRGGQAHQLETCLWHRYWHVQRLAAKRPVSGLVAEPLLMHWVQIRKNWPQINHGQVRDCESQPVLVRKVLHWPTVVGGQAMAFSGALRKLPGQKIRGKMQANP